MISAMALRLPLSQIVGSRWVVVSILAFATLLIAFNHWVYSELEQRSVETARTVNLMGRQRMLSQGITKNVALLSAESSTRGAAFDELISFSRTLRQNQLDLRPYFASSLTPQGLSRLENSLEGLGNSAYLTDTARGNPVAQNQLLNQLVQSCGVVVPLIDEAIEAYSRNQKESESKMRALLDLLGGSLVAIALVAMVFIYIRDYQVAQREEILRKQAVQAKADLEELHSWQSTLLESAGFAIVAVDPDGVIKTFNRTAEKMLGYTSAEVVGLATPALFHAPEEVSARVQALSREFAIDFESAFDALVYKARMNLPNEQEWTYVRRDGSRFPVLLTVTALRRGDASIRGYIGLAVDITDRKRAESELRAATHRAEKASLAKSEFLANISHEIRTPMNGVMGFAQLLEGSELQPQQKEFVSIIRSSADALLVIIDDILDFSKIEAGKLALELIPVDIRKVLGEVTTLLQPRFESQPKELIVEWSPDAPGMIQADPGRLRQVLLNLIGNATKFTFEGYVLIRALKDGNERIRVEVCDTGIGIPADKQAGLFEKFAQADGSTTRKFGGTGLGLAISRQLVLLMGGEMGFTSQEGVGSVFWFSLPAIGGPSTNDWLASTQSLRVLIVDDIEVNRRLLEENLKRWNIRFSSTDSGAAALRMLEEGQAGGEPFDVAILDMLMPEMDGEQLATLILANPLLQKPRLILLSSSIHSEADQARLLSLGFAQILSKPLVYPELLIKALSSNSTKSRVPLAEDLAPLRCSVLVVEDNAVNQTLMELMLQRMGCRVTLASDGSDAVGKAMLEAYDIILMDCQMPVMDGFEATRQLRSLGIQTPILALTANALVGDRELCLAAGMNDYITKPVNGRELRRRIEEWLGKI
jgi:PAS domain S-box-containing protein